MTYAKSAGIALLSAGLPGIAVAQSTFELGEIVVLPLAVPVEEGRTGASVETLGETDLEEAGDIVLGEQLARLPGVNLSRQGGPGANADIQIRGARTRYVAIYVDGILVTDPAVPTTQFDDFGGFTIGNVDRVEILKGSQSALYGGTAVGGVISVSTLGSAALGPGTHQEATVEGGSYGTLGAAYSITRNTERGSFTFGASTARSDGISAADENDGNTEADGFDRTRFTAGASYDLTDRVTVGANAFIETGRTEFDEFGPADGAPPFNEVSERDDFGARAFVLYDGPAFDNEFNLTWYQNDRTSTSDFGGSEFRGERLQATNVTSFDISDTTRLSLGLDYRRETARYANLTTGVENVDIYGAFAEIAWSPNEMLDIIATARIDDHSAFGSFETGRLAFARRTGGGTTFRGAIATGYRAPSIDELFGDYSAFGFTGNPDLEPETSVTAELGVDHAFAGGAEISATLFWGEIDNLITLTPDFSTLENIPGTSTRQGLELSGTLPVGDRAELYGAATFLEARGADGTPVPRVPTTDIVLGGNMDLSERLTGTANARYVAGIFDGGDYLPSFTVVNLGAEYGISERATAYVRVENLFDTEYQTTRGYGTPDRSFFAGIRATF